MGAYFKFWVASFRSFLPEVTFSSLPSFLAWARGAYVFLIANFLHFLFRLVSCLRWVHLGHASRQFFGGLPGSIS